MSKGGCACMSRGGVLMPYRGGCACMSRGGCASLEVGVHV